MFQPNAWNVTDYGFIRDGVAVAYLVTVLSVFERRPVCTLESSTPFSLIPEQAKDTRHVVLHNRPLARARVKDFSDF